MVNEKKRGFAALSPEARKEMARMAGRRSHALGRAHKWTQEEARAAGQKGAVSRRNKPPQPPETPRVPDGQ